jgi:hypothetical protein
MNRFALTLVFLCCGLIAAYQQDAKGRTDGSSDRQPAVVMTATAFGSSQKLSSFSSAKPSGPSKTKPKLFEVGRDSPPAEPKTLANDKDGAPAQSALTPMPAPSLSFDGLSNFDNIAIYGLIILPPDPIGDVGPGHYVQAVNSLVRIFDKNGAPLTPAFPISQIFQPLGTACSTRFDGEPVVLYDPLADRWLISQYCNNFPPFRQLIAISKTGDPTGSYFLYEFVMPNIRLNDFAKFGVWPDGYYMSTEEFTGSDYSGTGMFAFDRAKMLVGDPTAAYIYFSRPSLGIARQGNMLPADLDGLRPPPAGAPNVFAGYSATEYGEAADSIRLFDFHADFANPASSTFTERPESPLAVAAFDPTSIEGRQDISQPAPGEFLDANSDRLNYRAAYRNLGGAESLVLNQTVRLALAPYRAGVRIYELRRTSGAFSVTEQATIGDSSSSRWIASAAADHQGNLAVGYNYVTDTKQPSLTYTGRLASEPAGTFREETNLVEGTGVQRAFGWRWGDYSGMSVDPVDDCTFWMTGEYFTLASQEFSEFTWLTRIGRFKFAECTPAPRATITGAVTNSANGQAIANAKVTASAYSRNTAASGSYGSLAVLPGSYQITASAHGFRSQTFTVNPANGQTLTQNFSLEPVPVLLNTSTQIAAESCGTNGAPDPGENVSFTIALQNTGALPTQNLVVTLLTGGGVSNPGPAQNYGAMAVNGPAVSRTFSFTVGQVTCGAQLALAFHLQDGAVDLGNITIPLQTGTPKIAFRENFDRQQQAQLPPRWMRSETHTSEHELPFDRDWKVRTDRSTSPPKAAYARDIQFPGVNEMVTPVFFINTAGARLTFQNWYELETTFLRNRRYDGSVLEIKIGSGVWQNILLAGGVFESGGYDGPIDTCCQNPLGGQPGWSGRSGLNQTSEFITSSVRFPATAAGRPVQLRWRVGTDIGTHREGQYVDDILVTDGFTCGC